VTIGITQTLRSWVRSGLIEAADSLIDVSGEVESSIIREEEADGMVGLVRSTQLTGEIDQFFQLHGPNAE
jgi:hypothetical protein